jgi:hypothetical protein
MNKVFPRKWHDQHDRSTWGKGLWDGEPDREQWSDSMTGYPCLAIRCDLGMWAGYVGVYPEHPAFGQEIDDLPGVNFWCYTDEHHFIEPWPVDPNAVVNVDDPKESILQVVRMPDYLWFFGFDFAHAGDIIPSVVVAMANVQRSLNRTALDKAFKSTYKDLAYVKKTCETVAIELARMAGTKTMDSTRQRVFAS